MKARYIGNKNAVKCKDASDMGVTREFWPELNRIYDIRIIRLEENAGWLANLAGASLYVVVHDVENIEIRYDNLYAFLENWDIMHLEKSQSELEYEMYKIFEYAKDVDRLTLLDRKLGISLKIAETIDETFVHVKCLRNGRTLIKSFPKSEYCPNIPIFNIEEDIILKEMINEVTEIQVGESVDITLDEFKEVCLKIGNDPLYQNFSFENNYDYDVIYGSLYIYLNIKDHTGKTYGIQKKLKREQTCMCGDLNDADRIQKIISECKYLIENR